MTDEKEPPKKKVIKKKVVKKAKKPLYEKVMWKKVKPVYRCLRCNQCADTKDDLIFHIINHYPKNEQEKIMDRLLKE